MTGLLHVVVMNSSGNTTTNSKLTSLITNGPNSIVKVTSSAANGQSQLQKLVLLFDNHPLSVVIFR